MTKINNWKTITFIAVLAMSSVIIALQPTITYASGGSGSHVGG